ncbi:MAG: MarR family winged helix-turn-helix transcriptional regulator [Flammeovirgaceae bacterium]
MDRPSKQPACKEKVQRFLAGFTHLLVKMQEVDDSCVVITKNISKQDLWLIGFIGEQQSVIMREVAEFLSVPLSTATWVVDKLVKKRYLKRFNSPEDRRVVKVELTKKGKDTATFFAQKKQEMAELILSGLTKEQGDEFVNTLEVVSNNMRKHAEEFKPQK